MNMKLVALGDSIIKGVVLTHDGMRSRYALSHRNIVDQCAEHWGSEIVNLGKMGCTITAGERILDKCIERIKGARYVLLEYGGNDSDYNWQAIAQNPSIEHLPNTTLDVYEQTYERVINKLRQVGVEPLVLSLPPMDAERYFAFFSSMWSDKLKQNVLDWLGGTTNTIMSGHELYNMATLKVAQRTQTPWIDVTTGLIMEHKCREYLCVDGIHPNEKGQAKIAELILKQFNLV